ncbi:MAG TPA: tautomerase family protein [Drouetiella sp.]
MPHITVKLWPGKSEEQKKQYAERIVEEAIKIMGSAETSLSVAFEEISPDDWKDRVYTPEIVKHWDELYKKPGYQM